MRVGGNRQGVGMRHVVAVVIQRNGVRVCHIMVMLHHLDSMCMARISCLVRKVYSGQIDREIGSRNGDSMGVNLVKITIGRGGRC